MAIGPRLDLRQSQNLVMTPQLQQAIKLLQLSSIELNAFVEEELERNPLLERDEGAPDPSAIEDPDRHAEGPADPYSSDSADLLTGGAKDGALDTDHSNDFDGEIAGPGAEAYERGLDAGGFAGLGGNARGFDDDGEFGATLSSTVTLRDHLDDQLRMDIEDPVERMIGAHLIDALDPNGWIAAETEEIAARLGIDTAAVEAVLSKMQGFDPPGIFARSLQECLALQLKDQNRYDPAMETLMDNLDLVANREGERLKRLCGVDAEDLADMIRELRALNPRPASLFDSVVAEPVVPDVLLKAGRDGDWLVELNPEALPKVLVNERFHARIARQTKDKSDKDYLAERFQTANWLVKSLQQRATTILKVATEIVRQQDAFFRHGVAHLKPLILRDIAEAIEMHESTVSRVTSNKFIASPRGLFELKYFFTTAIAGTSGNTHSAESVRHRIKCLVDAESPNAILSDDKLVEILNDEGIDIARRTVAKYREAMRIPSSVQRRRMKKAAI